MRKSLLFLFLFCAGMLAVAQNGKVTVSGTVWDADLNEAMGQATVQLLSVKDSSFVNGGVTQMNGRFRLPAVKAGKYLLKVSFIGYLSQFKEIQLSSAKPQFDAGRIALSADAIMMQEAVVVGHVPPVQMSEDTVVFNSAAYRVSEGSALEELVKKLPGAEVSDDGSITINGKTVSKILLDGKEFFGSDMEMAMKNIPVEMVEKLKTYERQSDLARITGIDDGEEETVIDLSVKEEMKDGWITNTDVAGGTKSRYSAKSMVSHFDDVQKITFMGGLNNVGDRGIGGRGRGQGLRTNKHAGLNFTHDTEKLEVEGNARFRYRKDDNQTKSSSETFLDQQSSFENSLSSSISTDNSFNTDFKIEWRPDTLTNIIVRPRFSYGKDAGDSNSSTATFNDDPYADGITDPLEQLTDPLLADILLNSNRRWSTSNSNNTDANIELQFNRRLGSSGRNITIRGTAGFSDGDSESISLSRIQYYQDTQDPETAMESINRYSLTPSKNWNYSAQAIYSEPIFKGGYLQFRYNFQYKYSKSDRSTYDIGNVPFDSFELPSSFDDPDNLTLDKDQSRFAEYRNYIHNASISLRVTREKFRLNAGVTFVPQRSEMTYKYQGIDTAVVRTVSNFTPNIRFRYRFSKQTQFRLDYRGRTSQPSMTDLLDVTDDSDPLNITKGNPGLKPSFENNISSEFSTFNPEHQRNFMVRLEYRNTLNSISSQMTYNSETGVRTTMPQNINGTWNVGGGLNFSTALKNQKFTINTFMWGNYSNQPSYLFQDEQSVKNVTNNLRIGDRLDFRYRSDWFDLALNGTINYNNAKNKLQSNNNMNTYDFSYGGEAIVRLPWNMELSTNLSNSSRRGYSSENMNTDELIWNAQISQNFLKGNAATVTFQVFDILRNQSNVSRNISASMRRDTEYNSINSYCMLHFVYRLNIFGGKRVDDRPDERRGFGGPGGHRPPGGGFGRPRFR